ncbi:hypothetical protein OF83DRAFT_1159843 [Amylostereum chailletii]|nr:hypothetical protein OF83DRAFT_1159843 [Amylostereum chailletii]
MFFRLSTSQSVMVFISSVLSTGMLPSVDVTTTLRCMIIRKAAKMTAFLRDNDKLVGLYTCAPYFSRSYADH